MIPARGGSKGIPRKNLVAIHGRPLIDYTISAARRSQLIQRVIVSTDDAEIKNVALASGAEVIDRPAELAEDETPTLSVLKHAIGELEKSGWTPGIAVLLQPTVPFRRVKDIDAAIQMMISRDADAVVGVVRSEAPRNWIFALENGRIVFHENPSFSDVRRQAASPDYRINGSIYVYRTEAVRNSTAYAWGERVYGYVMDKRHSWDIDEPFDLEVAELLLASGPEHGQGD